MSLWAGFEVFKGPTQASVFLFFLLSADPDEELALKLFLQHHVCLHTAMFPATVTVD